MQHNDEHWDVIVIGSGAGGLTAAVALSNVGKRVLVLEQHYLPGGWTHSFSLKGHRFSPGVHYIGQLGPGGRTREILEGIGVGGRIEFNELNPDGYDHIVFRDETFDIPRGRDNFRRRLIERFPTEREGIDRYFRTMEKVNSGIDAVMDARGASGILKLLIRAPALVLHGLRPAGKVVDRFIRDPKLKAILEARAGDHGMSPEEVPFAFHAAIEGHYGEGAWYPRGGGGAIPKAMIGRLRQNGGEIRTSTRVKRVLLDKATVRPRAVGVETESGERLAADAVLSNADAWGTYRGLIGERHLSRRLNRKVNQLRPSFSALSLFVATDLDVEGLGLDSGNYWILHDQRVAATYDSAETDDLSGDGVYCGVFVTITSLKDPDKGRNGIHTLEAFTLLSEEPFRKWRDTESGDRPSDYAEMKQRLTDRMLLSIEDLLPGIRNHLVLCELASPLTHSHYVATHRGNIYGTAKTLRQIGPFAMPIRTEIDQFFHCGQSTTAHGVLGVMMTGMQAASAISGRNEDELLRFGQEGTIQLLDAEQSEERAESAAMQTQQ